MSGLTAVLSAPPIVSTVDHQRRLAHHLRRRLTPPLVMGLGAVEDVEPRALVDFLEAQETQVESRLAAVPWNPSGFVAWFESLRRDGPGQHDELFPWLAEEADEASMRWFLTQELAGEAGFDDLVALTLVRLPPRPKMEMARNLWDEFGRGNPAGVHGTLLARMAQELGLSCAIEDAVEEVLVLANLMAGLALERHVFQAIGALGVIELTAPDRVTAVAHGMHRLGMPANARRYFELHATLDVEHSRRWNEEILLPLVEADPRVAPLLAQGALMRLEAGKRCFQRYRAEFFNAMFRF